jgi:phosphohistidine phosphatase
VVKTAASWHRLPTLTHVRHGNAAYAESVAHGDSKVLLLLRHAKSSWDDPALADHDRPLAARGRKAAQRIGARLRTDKTPVNLVLCSSARRARETVELVAPPGELEIDDRLYGASPGELLQRLRQVPDDVGAVMLVGHNPAMRDLAIELLSGDGDQLVGKFPTGALATLTFTGSWRALAAQRAELIAFLKPRELD